MLGNVRQQRELASPLDGRRDLALVPAAGACQAAATKLAAVRDEAAKGGDVTPVNMLDLVLAVGA